MKGAKCHPWVRRNIQGITKSDIRRLARNGGFKYILRCNKNALVNYARLCPDAFANALVLALSSHPALSSFRLLLCQTNRAFRDNPVCTYYLKRILVLRASLVHLPFDYMTVTQICACRLVVFAAVRKDGSELVHASPELRGDRGVALAAVQQDGRALEHASEELKADREVVLAAVKNYGFALQPASPELKADREVVLAAVNQNGYAIRYASEECQRYCLLLESVPANNTRSKAGTTVGLFCL